MTSVFDVRSVEAALLRYRIIAIVVSVAIVVLCCVGVPLQVFADSGGVAAIVGTAHGVFFYPLYLLLTFDLGRRLRMPLLRILLTMAAGTIPFASFYAERRTTHWVHAQLRSDGGRAPAVEHREAATP